MKPAAAINATNTHRTPLLDTLAMKFLHALVAISLAAVLLAPGPSTAAGDDHGHDHGPAATAATGPAQPRFAAVSDLFELVGVLNGKQLTLYLDRAADNSPVIDAQIELEIGGRRFKATRQGSDTFEVVLPEAPKPGVLPVVATVSVGTDTDLLSGEHDIHEPAHGVASAPLHSLKAYTGWAVGGVAVLAVLALAGRRAQAARQLRAGGAA